MQRWREAKLALVRGGRSLWETHLLCRHTVQLLHSSSNPLADSGLAHFFLVQSSRSEVLLDAAVAKGAEDSRADAVSIGQRVQDVQLGATGDQTV